MSYTDTTSITKKITIETKLFQQVLQLLTKKKKNRLRLLNTFSAVNIVQYYKCGCCRYFINYRNNALADTIFYSDYVYKASLAILVYSRSTKVPVI